MTELRCADVEARLVDAIDGRLDPADSVRFHSHVEGCPACRERAALWRAVVPGMRGAVPPGPAPMALRRMQVEIERRLADPVATSAAGRWRAWWTPALAGLAVTAAVLIGLRIGRAPSRGGAGAGGVTAAAKQPAPPLVAYAAIVGIGTGTGDGVAVTRPATVARVPTGSPISVAPGTTLQLAVDGGATLRVQGPARFTLNGTPHDVAIHLAMGKLHAEVTHRQPRETFAVLTRDARVEVRGTKFSVLAAAEGSRVEVTEGLVAVLHGGGQTTLVSAGEHFDTAPGIVDPTATPSPAPDAGDGAGALDKLGRSPSCAVVARTCRSTAQGARASMRAGDPTRALRLIADARRTTGDGVRCSGRGRACDDELRYLHAEALNQSGRLDEAVVAYRALDRRGAPPAMRQNALYAAGQIERRQGRTAVATTDFERALAVAPRGALYEDALVGAMESARANGDLTRARGFAARYVKEFPRGLSASAARKLAGDGAR